MVLGILQFDLVIPGSESLKDKRRVVRSVKDRLHRDHMVSVAEVGLLETLDVARLGLALVGSDGQRVGQTLDRILSKLSAWPTAQLAGVSRQLVQGTGGTDTPTATSLPDDADEINREMLARAGLTTDLDGADDDADAGPTRNPARDPAHDHHRDAPPSGRAGRSAGR
jgi:uncharacterized protein YlxP (DUF503 family)